MKPIRIALIQICPKTGAADRNAEKIIGFLQEASREKAQLAVFPECSLSGYSTEKAGEIALAEGAEAILRIREESDRLNLAVCFGYVEREEDALFLTQELYGGGEKIRYRKTHPGYREQDVFGAGNAFPVKRDPVCTGLQLCWESHIPEISAAEREQGAELLLVPYASPMSGERCRENWAVHLPARASDNGTFLAACNLLFPAKEEGGSLRGGGLAVYDPKGRLLAGCFGTEERLLFCDLSGPLPRELPEGDIHSISYFDRKRPELF